MVEHQVPRYVYVTEAELATLISEAVNGRYLDARFGANRIWLEENVANFWVFKRLTQLRGIDLVYNE